MNNKYILSNARPLISSTADSEVKLVLTEALFDQQFACKNGFNVYICFFFTAVWLLEKDKPCEAMALSHAKEELLFPFKHRERADWLRDSCPG